MPEDAKTFSREIENLFAGFREVPEDKGRSRKRPEQDLGALVEALMVKHKIGRASAEQTIRDNWVQVVGAANASYSHAVTIEANKLHVLVSHSVVRNELFFHRQSIIAKIKALPGCATIRGLVLRSG